MVKRRETPKPYKQPTNEEIEAFASGADGGNHKSTTIKDEGLAADHAAIIFCYHYYC